jgi:DNA-directed RNA polymerase specialized sigma24 family protein
MDTELQARQHAESTAIEPPREATREAPSIDQIEAIERHLNGLPARQRMTVLAAIQRLKPSIEKLRARGYSVDEVAAELKARGLHISGRTLVRHLRAGVPKKRASATP